MAKPSFEPTFEFFATLNPSQVQQQQDPVLVSNRVAKLRKIRQ